ncbi:MAG: zinc metalloprotease HtpX [Nanoarchaeota archaeon]
MIINQIKTVLLLGTLTGLLLVVGGLLGGKSGLTIALIIALIMNFGMYFFSHKIVLMMYHAKEAPKSQYPKLHSMIEEICKEADLPKPRVYIVPTDNLNAFASGPSKKKAVVAVTEGILGSLTHDELKGVLAHELSHIKNRDMLITTIAATIAATISYIASMARFAAIFGGGRNDNNGRSNILSLLLLGILTPIIAMIIQLAISRKREYLADERGARLLKNGEPLARALEKLELSNKRNPLKFGSPTTSSLFIINPFSGQAFIQLFSTHPPIPERCKRLRNLKY